jgi:hypothetical protein
MVLVGNHHPSSSHIINQKKHENVWTIYQKHTCHEQNRQKKTQPDVLNFLFYNVRYAQKHYFWSWAITKNKTNTQIEKKCNETLEKADTIEKQNKKKLAKKKRFFLI